MITDTNIYPPFSIRTYSGKVFDYTVMDPDTILIEDIAHALANMPRFAGHTEYFFSVAQHSIAVMEMVEDKAKLSALLHDATEAYLMDIPKPLKMLLPDYALYEKRLENVIVNKFCDGKKWYKIVKIADQKALEIEFQQFHLTCTGVAWSPAKAEREFLSAYQKLTSKS